MFKWTLIDTDRMTQCSGVDMETMTFAANMRTGVVIKEIVLHLDQSSVALQFVPGTSVQQIMNKGSTPEKPPERPPLPSSGDDRA